MGDPKDAAGLEARLERVENYLRGFGLDVMTPEQAVDAAKEQAALAEQAAEEAKGAEKAATDEAKALAGALAHRLLTCASRRSSSPASAGACGSSGSVSRASM